MWLFYQCVFDRDKGFVFKNMIEEKISIPSPILFMTTALSLAVALAFQTQFILLCDTGWDLIVAKRLLSGGNYVKDFFDFNPPMIFWLLIPPAMLSKITNINLLSSLQIYTYSVALLFLFICHLLTRKIFSPQYNLLRVIFFSLLSFSFIVLPFYEIGQREHFLIMLCLPYLLLMVCRLDNQAIYPFYAVIIGLFAGIGFCIKPQFLIAFILMEFFFLIRIRNIFSWLRPENIAILFVGLIYLLLIIIYYPSFYSTILPFTTSFYYQGYHASFIQLFTYPSLIFSFMSCCLYLHKRKEIPCKNTGDVMCIATFSFIILYLLQLNIWYYHAIPALAVSILLFGITLFFCIPKKINGKTLLLLLVFQAIGTTLGYALVSEYKYGQEYKYIHGNISAFLNRNAQHKSIIFLSSDGTLVTDFPGTTLSGRFLHLFWIPSIMNEAFKNHYNRARNYESKLIDMISEDIAAKKPDFILVDSRQHQPYMPGIKLDYIRYLSQNSLFQNAWKQYHFMTRITQFPLKRDDSTAAPLYVFSSKDQISPKSLPRVAVILTGSQNPHIAYYILDGKVLTWDDVVITTNVHLSNQEQRFINSQQSGLIKKSASNISLVNSILHKANDLPSYQLDVYQRS